MSTDSVEPCRNPFSHLPQPKSVTEILRENAFSFSAEIVPPRNGSDFQDIFAKIHLLKEGGFHFISVTHGAGGTLRGGTLPIAFHAQSVCQMTSIAHLTCRGLTSEEMENLLIDHHYFQIHNILALRGDPPDGNETEFQTTVGGYSYAYQLVQALQRLNKGRYSKRKNFDQGEFRKGIATRFCVGVAVYPEKDEWEYLKIKKEAGADFGISQMIFSAEKFLEFHKKAQTLWGESFPILPGIRVVSSLKQLLHARDKFRVHVPPLLLQQMQEAEQVSEEAMCQVGYRWALDFVQQVREQGVRGAHFFIMGNPSAAVDIKKEIQSL